VLGLDRNAGHGSDAHHCSCVIRLAAGAAADGAPMCLNGP